MPKISVIVPIYNAEKYLERCVKSLIAQTFHDIEILLIDDGSTDASSILCTRLKKEDSRIRILHKPQQCAKRGSACGKRSIHRLCRCR